MLQHRARIWQFHVLRGRIIKTDVATKEKRRRIAGRDVMATVEQGAAEFTTPGGKKRQVRQGETICERLLPFLWSQKGTFASRALRTFLVIAESLRL
jgi:hypothetical protein